MPKGSNQHGQGGAEAVGRQTITGFFLEILPMLLSRDPRAWEAAALRINEAKETAFRTSSALERAEIERAMAVGFQAPRPISADLEEAWAALAPGLHRCRIHGSTVDPAFLGALRLHGRR
jgi:hypothetical protein